VRTDCATWSTCSSPPTARIGARNLGAAAKGIAGDTGKATQIG
jgi:hypothetical protein